MTDGRATLRPSGGIDRRLPQQHHCIRAPGPPCVGAPLEVARAEAARGAAKYEIGGHERVGLVERPHRDVGRCPVADAGDRGQRGARLFEAVSGIEANAACRHASRQRADGNRA